MSCLGISRETYSGPVAQWIRHLTTNQGIASSSPARVKTFLFVSDEVAEWLRRWTANPMGSARVGSNPILVGYFFHPSKY